MQIDIMMIHIDVVDFLCLEFDDRTMDGQDKITDFFFLEKGKGSFHGQGKISIGHRFEDEVECLDFVSTDCILGKIGDKDEGCRDSFFTDL